MEQMPKGNTIQHASEFKHFMKQTAINLKKLGLPNCAEAVEKWAEKATLQINTLAEFKNFVREVTLWLNSQSISRAAGVMDLQSRREIAGNHLKKAGEMAEHLKSANLNEVTDRLREFIRQTDQQEKEFNGRFSRLLQSSYTPLKAAQLLQEIEDLEKAFKGCDLDQQKLRGVRKLHGFLKDAEGRLSDNSLSSNELASLKDQLTDEAREVRSQVEGESPWDMEKALSALYNEIRQRREKAGLSWIEAVTAEISALAGDKDISRANHLHGRLQQMPAYLSDAQREKALAMQFQVETCLSNLKVEWLVEKYKELDQQSRQSFLKAVEAVGRQSFYIREPGD